MFLDAGNQEIGFRDAEGEGFSILGLGRASFLDRCGMLGATFF